MGTLVPLDTFSGKDLNVDDCTAHTGRHTQRCIFHIGCFFTENGAQQFLFGSQLGFTLRRYFTHQHVAGFHFRTDINDTGFVQTALHTLGQVRNITGNIFRTQLGVAGNDIQLFNMNRGITVVCGHLFRNQNRVFIVVSVPRHKGDNHVLTQSQLTQVGRCAIGHQIATLQYVSRFHSRTLVDICGLIGTGEFHQIVNIHAYFAGNCFVVMDAHYHTVSINIFNHTAATRDNGSGTIHRNGTFDTGTDHRFFSTQTRHSLALHVGTHQSTVRIIMLQEWNQRGCNRYCLTGCHIHILNPICCSHDGLAFLTASDQIIYQMTFCI